MMGMPRAQVHKKCDRLDLLINNAGVFSQSMVKTVDGNEQTFQVICTAR